MCPRSSTERYPAFARIGLRKNPGKNLNQVSCPDRDSNPGHLVSRPDALTITAQGTVKDSVYQNILTTPDDMQQRIRQACVSIQPATCRAVIRSFGERLRISAAATGVAQSVKALACRSEVALGRGFDPCLG
ncbi:hypothetical protein ANN_01591 [Periplaneta americana]|uniref:Uncharacterized protein n=1 Tax=Periplaneta americana TaxID=6978 RepID=A0ABQ8TXD6_PERAM|nr:hypothetical protein ANN_01591 [Periplaneta americana]